MCMWLYVYGANLGSKSMDGEYWIPKNWCLFEPPICPPLQVVGSSEGLSQLQTIAQL